MASNNREEGTLCIGIDFGTTFTGVAYEFQKGGPEGQASKIEPRCVRFWPAVETAKIDSKVAYDKDGSVSWGREAANKDNHISWFKLLLLEDGDLKSHLQSSKHIKESAERLESLGKDPIDLVTDYLRCVWEHALFQITEEQGNKFMERTPFHVMVTVPAIWPDYALQRMDRALQGSGILRARPSCKDTTYSFILEPEAAAFASILGLGKYETLRAGPTFVIGDLGGGTVDITSFVVRKENLELAEGVEGDGGLCGATFLDQAFLAGITKKISGAKYKSKKLKAWEKMHPTDRRRVLEFWENETKRKYYDGAGRVRFDMGVLGNLRPELWMETDELNDIFATVYKDILALFEVQVKAIFESTGVLPKFIVLVGGLGGCNYIYEKLKAHYDGRIEILRERSDASWTAVARGAVIAGSNKQNREITVHSRVSRYSYSWTKHEEYDPAIHSPLDLDINDVTGDAIARDQMVWFIKRGEKMAVDSPKLYDYVRHFTLDQSGVISFSETIYRSERSEPPVRLAENGTKYEGPYGEALEDGFCEFATIDMKTPVPVEKLPLRGNKDHKHRLL
ncbi:Uu.00g088320.m01.CDS01 [Anthostomella pinea]|uniref:Uu.00g088320.m01.CDS01 n=1 Tax=Anthostomella pinea TaxID=933095 RepID=A0AAI8VNF7_9PEZI|nr:Uu.00g088320.m01.CDS01 [Anthostomella pinea]